jgi:acyl-CoA synthetase (AMP-forming)/AMP-acid ligase II
MSAQAFTVYDLLVRGASLHGDAPALIQSTRQWTFRQLLERADRLAAGLAGLGLSRGDRICILAQNDVGYVDLYGACARQGIIAYPINWRLTAPEVERVLERALPVMMVADASTLAVVGEWPRSKRGIAHWYQLGEAPPAPGFAAL